MDKVFETAAHHLIGHFGREAHHHLSKPSSKPADKPVEKWRSTHPFDDLVRVTSSYDHSRQFLGSSLSERWIGRVDPATGNLEYRCLDYNDMIGLQQSDTDVWINNGDDETTVSVEVTEEDAMYDHSAGGERECTIAECILVMIFQRSGTNEDGNVTEYGRGDDGGKNRYKDLSWCTEGAMAQAKARGELRMISLDVQMD
ncbi:hypothetical protein B0H66DRAFT_596879 [Apodospora peruviana]|uniref:Uncharacterized protein n=1 Tax=Apodospora peruviana TaxID=516989 RepID=A0AAE0MFN6_9PEZI|nr:hypothetical protein B0H66DRAFT_596879 [Apodospora peruviana]